jgi:hypothetical protein
LQPPVMAWNELELRFAWHGHPPARPRMALRRHRSCVLRLNDLHAVAAHGGAYEWVFAPSHARAHRRPSTATARTLACRRAALPAMYRRARPAPRQRVRDSGACCDGVCRRDAAPASRSTSEDPCQDKHVCSLEDGAAAAVVMTGAQPQLTPSESRTPVVAARSESRVQSWASASEMFHLPIEAARTSPRCPSARLDRGP